MEQRSQAVLLADVLGGSRTLGARQPQSDSQWHEVIERGLPYRSIHSLGEWAGLSDIGIGEVIGIAKSTLIRRRSHGRFTVDESDKIYRFGRILSLARLAMGNSENIAAWLNEPNLALNRKRPLSLVRTEAGAREVEATLGRFIFGGYS